MRPIMMALSTSVLALGLTACTGARTWQYPPDPPGALLDVKGSRTIPANVAVLPLRDLRSRSEQRQNWVVAVPLVPYGISSFDRPETVRDAWGNYLIHMNPSRDFAQAIADELQHAGVFSSVSVADRARAKPDLILSGTLRATTWERTLTTYGLGAAGAVLWVLGAPMGNNTNTVTMDLQLAPAADPSHVVWQFTMQFQDTRLIGIYYGRAESVESYAEGVQEALKPAITNLAKIATEHPEMLRPIQARTVGGP